MANGVAGAIVLAVHPHADRLDLLRRTLLGAGAHVRTASTPERASSIVLRERVDAVVFDPASAGGAWIARARGGEGRRPFAIAITPIPLADASSFDVQLVEPLDPGALVAALSSLLEPGDRQSRSTVRIRRVTRPPV